MSFCDNFKNIQNVSKLFCKIIQSFGDKKDLFFTFHWEIRKKGTFYRSIDVDLLQITCNNHHVLDLWVHYMKGVQHSNDVVKVEWMIWHLRILL